MFTDDDVLTTRWQRWHRRVMALNLDALLRWSLVATAGTLTLFSALAILTFAWSFVAGAVGLLWGAAQWLR